MALIRPRLRTLWWWAIAAGLAAVLYSEYLVSGLSPTVLRTVAKEIVSVARDASTQWMVYVCLLVYLATFISIRLLRARGGGRVGLAGGAWLLALVAISTAHYAFGYAEAQRTTHWFNH